jgi:Spy/CpxP family protein refolding chaperone
MTLRNFGLTMVLLMGATSLALAQGPGGGTASTAGKGAADQKSPISDLTPEQKGKIAALRAAAMEKAAPLRNELDAKMTEMRQLWAAEKPDRKAITGKQAEMDAIHQKMRAIWTDFGLDVHALLTPAQRAEWAQAGPGHGMGMGPGMMGGGGPKGRRGGGPGRGHGAGMGPGMGMGQGMDGCPCASPMCPMNTQ